MIGCGQMSDRFNVKTFFLVFMRGKLIVSAGEDQKIKIKKSSHQTCVTFEHLCVMLQDHDSGNRKNFEQKCIATSKFFWDGTAMSTATPAYGLISLCAFGPSALKFAKPCSWAHPKDEQLDL